MLFLDIETEANPAALECLQAPQPPKNYKDPDKIAKYIEDKQKEQVAKAALDQDYGMITAAAVRLSVDSTTKGWLVNERRTEADLLRTIWSCIEWAGGYICGYNVIGFDLPYIIRRSFERGVNAPMVIDLNRYQVRPITDLMLAFAHWDIKKVKSLKFICQRYGIENPLPDLDGSQYAEMPPEIRLLYVKNDVDMTVALYRRMVGYYI